MGKIAIYTAIVDAYDDLPAVHNVEEDIDYIAFCDQEIEAKKPWQVRKFTRVFADPQRDARRIKLLPHLFLPEYTYSMWIDATIYINKCPAKYIKDCLVDTVIACPSHPEWNCVYTEADRILAYDVDDPGQVSSQLKKYECLGLPRELGLHTTTFLIRKHHDSGCKHFSYLWWEELSRQSKRDQLSFDFVRWILKKEVKSLPFLMDEGEILCWGPRKYRHKVGHAARMSTRDLWPYPNLSYDYSSFYQEYEIPQTFLLKAVEFFASKGLDLSLKLPLPVSNSGRERRALSLLLPSARKVLFIGDFSPLWILWADELADNCRISWVFKASLYLNEARDALASFRLKKSSLIDSSIPLLLEKSSSSWLESFDLVILDLNSLESIDQFRKIMESICPAGRIMFFADNDLAENCGFLAGKLNFSRLLFSKPAHVYEKARA